MTVDRNGRRVLNKYGEILALRRARLVAGAQEKLEALKETVDRKSAKALKRWITNPQEKATEEPKSTGGENDR